MNNIELDDLNNLSKGIDEINSALDVMRNTAKHGTASHQAFKGVDEYLTTAVMLILEIIKNETAN